MTRDIFVRVATTALRQNPGRPPEEQAEAIALLMDTVASVLGDAPPPVAQALGPPPPAFPRYNPEAIAPVREPEPSPEPEPSLIIPATRIPDHVEPVAPMAASAPPVRSLRPVGRMKVEELSQLIQERTPTTLPLDVPMGDGTFRHTSFQRNVISMHNFDSVKLVYFPPNTVPSVRESAEVMVDLHIDDVPFDLPAILKKLTEQAITSIRPQRPVVSQAPAPTSGPVMNPGDTYRDPASSAQVQGLFNSLG